MTKNADMLVKLYELPDDGPCVSELGAKNVEIRHAGTQDKLAVIDWVAKKFSKGWVAETEIAFQKDPATCIIAIFQQDVIGFCCYDTSALGFCGPIGVDANNRKLGIGRALLLVALNAMKRKGYGYAAIGWVRETQFAFYEKTVGAIEIPNSFPGIYRDRIKDQKPT